MTEFYVQIEDSSGNKQGNGPITSASQWKYTARMDKAGDFEFVMPATDPKAFAVQKKRIARAYARINGAWVEVGAGIIDRIEKQPRADGSVILRVSGDDLIRELTYRSVLNLKLYNNGLAVSHASALSATSAYAPVGWTFTPDGSPPNNSIYGYFNGETVLAAMVKIADKSQNHFYRGTGRTLIFASSFAASGVRAIQATGDLAAETCAIVSLTEQIDTYDLITRIYPRGSGNANVQLTLRATTRSAPSGYTLDTTNNYIENTTATATYGRIERQVDFRDIGPVANTNADVQAASNMLFDAALETLKRRSTELEQATYTLQIAGCSQLLRPMQSIRVVYRDTSADLNINTDLNILEATWQVDNSGIYTTNLVVSNADRWPKSDVGTIVDGIEQGQVYQSLPQLNANAYVTAYNKNVDHEEVAAFRFRFGNEVTQLQQVLFEFQLLPFESTVKSVSSTVTTTSSGGSSAPTTSSGGGTTSSSGGSHSHTISAHTHNVTIADHTHSVTIAGHTHNVTIPGHTHDVTVAAHSHTVPNHQHQITVAGGSGGTNLTLSEVGGLGFLTKATAGDVKINTNSDTGSTTSNNGGGTTVTSTSGGGSTPTTSSGGGSTPTTSAGGGTTVSSASGGGSTSSSDGSHTHTIDAHTHTVTIPAHTHTVTPVINAVYGIFRADVDDTYEIGSLEYRVNSGSWTALSGATDAGDGWYQVDITSQVQDSTTFRPLQTNNLLEIRAKTTGSLNISSWSTFSSIVAVLTPIPHNLNVGDRVEIIGASLGFGGSNVNGEYVVSSIPDILEVFLYAWTGGNDTDSAPGGTLRILKTATIDAQLSVRNTIQAIAYT